MNKNRCFLPFYGVRAGAFIILYAENGDFSDFSAFVDDFELIE